MSVTHGLMARRVGVSLAAVVVLAVGASAQTIRGHLLDAELGEPIDLGLVIMLAESGDSVTHTLTDRRGYFSITSPNPGSFELVGSALGYEESEAGVFDLGMGGELIVEFRLTPRPLPIDEFLVVLARPVLQHKLIRNGCVRRYQRNAGGRFITPHEIEESPARTTPDLFLGMPGVTVRPRRFIARAGSVGTGGNVTTYVGDEIVMQGPGGLCKPALYLDGARVGYGEDGSIDSLVPIHAVEAVEVYRGPAEIPVEYNATQSGSAPCGVIVFWTR